MAVVSVKQRRQRKRGQSTQALTGERVFLVTCDNINDGPEVAEAGCGVAVGSAWSAAEPSLLCQELSTAEYEQSGTSFEVTASYSTISRDSQNTSQTDPTEELPEVTFGFLETEEPFELAQAAPTAVKADGTAQTITWLWGKRVCNSAGQPFDPAPTQKIYDPYFSFTRNEGDWSPTTAIAYMDAVNSDAFNISYRDSTGDWATYAVAIGQAKITAIVATYQYRNGVYFWRVQYEIQIRQDGWDRKVCDQGKMELSNGDIPCHPIRDSDGDPVSEPAMLDGSGAKIASGDQPIFLVFKPKKTAVFGTLNFEVS